MRTVGLLVVVACALGCGKKGDGGGGGGDGDIKVSFEGKQVGGVFEVTVTTEPGVHLYAYMERGHVDPEKQDADASGKAKYTVSQVVGDTTLIVQARRGDNDRMVPEHKFKLARTEAAELIVEDTTPFKEGQDRTACSGAIDSEAGGLKGASLCPIGGLVLAADYSVGLRFKVKGGQKVVLGTQTVEFKDDVAEVRVALLPELAAISYGDLTANTGSSPIKFPVTVEHGGMKRAGNLTFSRDVASTFLTNSLRKGPALFPGETAGTAKKASLLILGEKWEVTGEAQKLGDIDLVGIISTKFRNVGKCDYVATDGSKEKKTVTLTVSDLTSTVYDRRTGKKLGAKSFTATAPKCAAYVTADDKGKFEEASMREAIEYAETFVAK